MTHPFRPIPDRALPSNGIMKGPLSTSVPILGARKPTVWRCSQGHEYQGDPPKLTFPLSQNQVLGVSQICIICTLNHLQRLFPVVEVVPESNSNGEPKEEG